MTRETDLPEVVDDFGVLAKYTQEAPIVPDGEVGITEPEVREAPGEVRTRNAKRIFLGVGSVSVAAGFMAAGIRYR